MCICGLSQNYADCCGRFIEGACTVETPEQLMRTRYVAFTQANADYVKATMAGKAAENFDLSNFTNWSKNCTWLPLMVLSSKQQGNKGTVEFETGYKDDSGSHFIHEISQFERIDGRWYYTDGKHVPTQSNESCPCGSGKKFKRCCK
tara:strand:- start:60376 stop:60816 length:441 start_codon:yes stop_codon:yes gene_type:complete